MPDREFVILVERLRANDPDAAQALVDRYGDAIRREARMALLSRDLKRLVSESDICQSVLARFFVGLWAGSYDVDDDQQLMGLLKTMVRARVVDLHRRHTADKRDVRRTRTLSGDVPLLADNKGSTPSQLLMHRELWERFTAALPDRCRSILELRQERRGWSEIAQALGEPGREEALRKQYERAVAKATQTLGLDG